MGVAAVALYLQHSQYHLTRRCSAASLQADLRIAKHIQPPHLLRPQVGDTDNPAPALALHQVMSLCHLAAVTAVVPPPLHVPGLSEAIEQERTSPDAFSQQPYYFMELACLVLEGAKDSFTGDNDYLQVCARRSAAKVSML